MVKVKCSFRGYGPGSSIRTAVRPTVKLRLKLDGTAFIELTICIVMVFFSNRKQFDIRAEIVVRLISTGIL